MNEIIDIVLLRHGHSMTAAESGTDSDSGRKLSDRGKEEIVKSSNELLSNGFLPDLILTSPLLRAVQTSELVFSHFMSAKHSRSVILQELPELSCQMDLNDLIRSIHPFIKEKNSVIIIGHQPVLGALAGYLCGESPIDLKTGGFVHLKINRKSLACNFKKCGTLVKIYNP